MVETTMEADGLAMTSGSDRGDTRGAGARILGEARRVADTGDRWFVRFGGSFGRMGRWFRREATVVSDSASAAFATTMEVGRKLTGQPKREVAPARLPQERWPNSPVFSGSAAEAQGTHVDLLAATPLSQGLPAPACEEPSDAETAEPSSAATGGRPAGVVPLLRALGRVVHEHAPRGYESLARDERFWALSRLLNVLAGNDPATEFATSHASGTASRGPTSPKEMPGEE